MQPTTTPSVYGKMDYSKDPNGVRVGVADPTPTSYTSETRTDGNGNPYTVRVPATSPSSNMVKAPAVITSDKAKENVASNVKTLNEATSGSKAPVAPAGYRSIKSGSSWIFAPIGSSADVADQMKTNGATKEQVNNALSGSLGNPVDKGTDGPVVPPVKSNSQLKLERTQSELESLGSKISSQNSGIIESIKSEYAGLIKQQEENNKQYQGMVTKEGIRSGRGRYAPDIYNSDNARAVDDGIAKVASLVAKKEKLVREAEQAATEADYKRLNTLMTSYKDAVKEERQAAQDALDNMVKWNKEVRDKTTFDRTEQEKTAEDIAGSLSSVLGNNEEDNALLVQDAASQYGIDPNILITKLNALDAKDMTAEIKEYNLAKKEGYKGSFMQYKKAFKAASSAAKAPSALTFAEASRYDLPEELIGKTDLEVIEDLSVAKVPEWFKISQVRSGNIEETAGKEELQRQWNMFRTSPDLDAYKTINLNKKQILNVDDSNPWG